MLQEKLNHLRTILRDMESIVVAFSGGVDSTFLLKIAMDELGTNSVLAVTADSETYPTRELEEAKQLASLIGAPHKVIQTSELAIPGYTENDYNRCYFCKQGLFSHLIPILEDHGYSDIVYGLITDDMSDHRPGVKAAKEFGVRSPLQEANLFKEEIRQVSKELNLPTWDKPSFACLSSRIAYGEKITQEKLTSIDKAESFLRQFGIKQMRVRKHGDIARIEVEPDDMKVILENHHAISEQLQEYGYKYITMDLIGYKSGSMNKVIS